MAVPQDHLNVTTLGGSRLQRASWSAVSFEKAASIQLLGAQGVPLKVIAEIVGHSDVRLTQNVYQHVYQDARRDAACKMDA